MAEFGIDLSFLNGELSRMVKLGNRLYFRRRKYIYSASRGRTKNRVSGRDSSYSSWGRVTYQGGDYETHIIAVRVSSGEIVKLTPMTINRSISVMTLYRNATEQVFLTYGRLTVDWLVEVYAPQPVKDAYGIEIYDTAGERLWSSTSPTLFPAVVSSPMYYESSEFNWSGIEASARRAGFSRLGVVFDPSQNAIIKGQDLTSGGQTIFTAALGVVWEGDYRLSKDFMVHSVGYGSYSHSTVFSVSGFNLTGGFNDHSTLKRGQTRLFQGVDAMDWFTQQVSVFKGEKWRLSSNGTRVTGVYKSENSVFYQRSTSLICLSDI